MKEGEWSVLGQRLDFLVSQLGPEAQEARIQRVISIEGLPDLDEAANEGSLDVGRLLEVRESRECEVFRGWLRTLDEASDEEIRDHVQNVRRRLGSSIRSGRGRALRFLATAGLGAIPIAGPLVGAAGSAADAFLLEKLLPESGPVTFLGSLYPSIFRD
jgi:hypothetical protein